MSQTIYDKPEFFEGYSKLGRSVEGLAGAAGDAAGAEGHGGARSRLRLRLGLPLGPRARRCRSPRHGSLGEDAEGPRRTDWIAKGVIKQHRTIATHLNLLLALGFVLVHVEEWGPSAEQIAARPALADERQRPPFLLVSTRRPD